ncbi:nucleoporin GLE1 [Ceratobasidium sp. AG-Ba]|nr:nucleoporin GLE1 [Ceratobasidium sp. AG-Ba]QRW07016.1 nucleoporin GLE1 [Ceratobasidium sp. AG-Ba]
MRFSVSRSPSPVQRSIRRPTNTYSIHNATDSESEDSSAESEPDAPVLTFSSLSRALTRSNPEQTVDTFLAAVRLRARPDPVEEYREAERALLKTSEPTSALHLAAQTQLLQDAHAAVLAQRNSEEMETVIKSLAQLDMQRAGRSEAEARRVKEGVKGMWDGIEGAIKRDEELRRRAEEERRRVEEEKRRQEDEQRRKEQERAKAEADKKQKEQEEERAKRAAQEAQAQAEKEAAAKAEADRLRKVDEEKEKAAKAKAEEVKVARSTASGLAAQEWENAWTERATLKSVARAVEENSEMKSIAGRLRRKLRTRVGQVTNSRQELEKLADAIHEILSPTPPHPSAVYTALLSAFCKYLLLQAETEATAKLSIAYPLGRLVWMIISRGHDRLAHVFFARLVGRTGGWACGWALARKPGVSDTEWRKMIGLELEGKNDPDDKPPTLETAVQYTDRLVGQIALYASVLQSPLPTSLPFAATPNPLTAGSPQAILNSRELLAQSSAPPVLSVILEVAGDRLNEVYGGQFKKLMGAVAEAVKAGVGGENETPARVRLQLLVERWAQEGTFGLPGRELV